MSDQETQDTESKAGGDPSEGGAESLQGDREDAKKELEEIEENPPENLEDWPDGKAKYETLGGPEHDTGYEEVEEQLGPSDVRHHKDGSVTVKGEEVDDPDEYKGDPIPGGPTDPDAAKLAGDKTQEQDDDGDDDSDDDSDSDSDSDD